MSLDFSKRKQEIATTLDKGYKEILTILEKDIPTFENSNEIATYILANPKHKKALMEYRVLCCREKDENYPVTPIYELYADKLFDLSQYILDKKTELWLDQWNNWRQSGRKKATNILYKYDYLKEFITCPKYPIISRDSLADFLYETDLCLQKCDNWGFPQFEQTTFVQPLFAQTKDGKILRFMRVVELTNCEKRSGKAEKLPTFDFSVAIKVMPDDNLEHSSCLIRFDSKDIGHNNIFGEKNFEMSDDEQKERFLYERLYHLDKKTEEHFHFFDRTNQLIYISRPTSANSVTLSQLIKIGKNEYHDNTAFSGLPSLFVGSAEQVKRLVKLKETLHLANNRLDGKRYGERRCAWRTQLDALKQTIKLVDTALCIYPEQELETGLETILSNSHRCCKNIQLDTPDNFALQAEM